MVICIVFHSRLSSAAQQSDGAGGAPPVHYCQAIQEAAYHPPCTQSVILQDEAESLPILGQSSELSPGQAPSCIIISHMSHAKDELLAHRSSIPQQPSWNSSP